MAESCLLYYITDRTAFAADETTRRRRVLDKIAEAAWAGVDYIQLREKDLPTRDLESLAFEAARMVRESRSVTPGPSPRAPSLLINSRTDVAIAVGAEGVHLRSGDISPQEVRKIWCGARAPQIGVSCHSQEEVHRAAEAGATFAVFAPVFEKKDAPGSVPIGPSHLQQACCSAIPVLALGGINLENAQACLEAGAAGIAGIRLFQENTVAEVVNRLRNL